MERKILPGCVKLLMRRICGERIVSMNNPFFRCAIQFTHCRTYCLFSDSELASEAIAWRALVICVLTIDLTLRCVWRRFCSWRMRFAPQPIIGHMSTIPRPKQNIYLLI